MNNSVQSKQEIARRLLGAWTLITWVEIQSNGKQVYPLGKGAVGQIIYSADGHVAAQLVRRRRAHFRSEDWRDATKTEGARAWNLLHRCWEACRDSSHRGRLVSQPAAHQAIATFPLRGIAAHSRCGHRMGEGAHRLETCKAEITPFVT
jgi:Lipocalin-like domain